MLIKISGQPVDERLAGEWSDGCGEGGAYDDADDCVRWAVQIGAITITAALCRFSINFYGEYGSSQLHVGPFTCL